MLAISPLDGRYYKNVKILENYFSEYAIIKERVKVEIDYLLELSDILNLDIYPSIKTIHTNFTLEEATQVKQIEAVTKHDVKAVEYYLRERIRSQWIHFGLTSADVNSPVFMNLIKGSVADVLIPKCREVQSLLFDKSRRYMNVPMLSRTHGQPATPTTVGKEFAVFHERLKRQLGVLTNGEWTVKFGGATGGMNAHYLAYPDIDWLSFADRFMNKYGLVRECFTTQIDSYDNMVMHFDALKRINTILIDLCTDIWDYISRNYFKLAVKEGEVGSSTMPHKVNPIDFENAEAHFKLANALLEFFARKLPNSRLQRDLTDSATLRYVGEAFGMMLQALTSLTKGLNKIDIDTNVIKADLDANWIVIAEGIQTVLKRENVPDAYERIKELTRGVNDRAKLVEFIEGLDVPNKEALLNLTAQNYKGVYREVEK